MDFMSAAQVLGNFGEFLGSVAVVVTLIYLAVQVRTARSDVDANSFNSTNGNSISVDNAFLENAEIWTKATSGQGLTPNEEFIFDTLTDLRANNALFGFRRSLALGNGREHIHAINLAIFFWENPTAYQRWLEREKGRLCLRDAAGWQNKIDFVKVVENAVAAMKT